MARSTSGRIVIEIEPEFKQMLHAALALNGRTLKDWFLEHAHEYVQNASQLPLGFEAGTEKSD